MKIRNAFLIVLLLSTLWTDNTKAQSSNVFSPLAFNFQGRLYESGTPANNLYDFQFRLFDAQTNGVQAGPLLSLPAVGASNGFFNASLDFGPSVFTGSARWLEIQRRVT